MSQHSPISRVINLIPEESQRLWTVDESEGRRRLLASDVDGVLELDGSFALVAQALVIGQLADLFLYLTLGLVDFPVHFIFVPHENLLLVSIPRRSARLVPSFFGPAEGLGAHAAENCHELFHF